MIIVILFLCFIIDMYESIIISCVFVSADDKVVIIFMDRIFKFYDFWLNKVII